MANPISNPYETPQQSTPTGGAMVVNDPFKAYNTFNIASQTTPAKSTTTASNTSINNQVPGIIAKNQNLSNVGITSNANGATYANGTAYTPPVDNSVQQKDIQGQIDTLTQQMKLQQEGQANGTIDENGSPITPKASTYVDYAGNTVSMPQDSIIPPGVTLSPDGKGNYLGSDGKQYAAPTGDISYDNQQITNNLASIKAASDAAMASAIDGIQKAYDNYITQQNETNRGQQAGTQNALLMGGVTGTGSSAQYAPISSQGIMTAQINYGMQQITKLQNDRDALIAKAKAADYSTAAGVKQLYDLNTQLEKNRDAQIAEATKLNEKIATQSQKLADAKLASDQDTAIANELAAGITNPAEILTKLKNSGLNVTAKQISDTIGNLAAQSGISVANFTGETKNFMALKDAGQLPSSITALPEGQQLTAYLQMVRNIETSKVGGTGSGTGGIGGTYIPGDNPLVDAWAEQIQNGSKKITDIPATAANSALRNAVVVALQSMGNSTDGKPTTTEMGKEALNTAKELKTMIENGSGTSAIGGSRFWLGGALTSKIPGTPGYDLTNKFQSLKDKLSLEGVKYLKGQGQVSDAERAMLASAVTDLRLGESDGKNGEFLKSLNKIIDKLQGNIQTTSSVASASKIGDFILTSPENEAAIRAYKQDNPNATDEQIASDLGI